MRSSYSSCDAILLDTAVKGSNSGGTGAAFDWNVAKHCQEMGTGINRRSEHGLQDVKGCERHLEPLETEGTEVTEVVDLDDRFRWWPQTSTLDVRRSGASRWLGQVIPGRYEPHIHNGGWTWLDYIMIYYVRLTRLGERSWTGLTPISEKMVSCR